MLLIDQMMLMMTSDRTNDVRDKEGKPADDEDAHHSSQSLCSFCLFWDPLHNYHHNYDHDADYDDEKEEEFSEKTAPICLQKVYIFYFDSF